jgi:predicted SprT family Zn-dependent metalloprotease
MDTREFENFARECMNEHGLKNWTLAIHSNIEQDRFQKLSGKRTLAKCSGRYRTLTFAEHHIKEASQAILLQTILHEIAHALVYIDGTRERFHHGPLWKNKIVAIGGLPITYGGGKQTRQIWFPECPRCHFLDKSRTYLRYVRNKVMDCTCGYTGRCNWTGGREVVAEVK